VYINIFVVNDKNFVIPAENKVISKYFRKFGSSGERHPLAYQHLRYCACRVCHIAHKDAHISGFINCLKFLKYLEPFRDWPYPQEFPVTTLGP